MNNEKISSVQMALLMYPTIIATAILSLPSITAKYAQHDLWMSPIIASVLGFITVYLAVRLHDQYPGQTVIQFSEQIAGRTLGKVFGLIFLFFYIQTTGEIARAYSEFIAGSFLFKTPMIVIISLMVLLSAFAVHGGLQVIARVCQLFFPLFIVPLIFLIILLSPDFEPQNALPILEKGIIPPMKGAIVPSGWFSEFFMIVFILPFLSDRKKAMRNGMLTVLAVMLTLVIVNLVVLFVLGETTASKIYPLMNVSRYISYGVFLENMEAVTMAVWIIGTFVKISVFYYVAALGTAQWLKLSDYRPIVWPLGIIIVEFSYWGLPSQMKLNYYESTAFPFYSAFIQVCLPLLLLVIALLRKIGNKGSG